VAGCDVEEMARTTRRRRLCARGGDGLTSGDGVMGVTCADAASREEATTEEEDWDE
jgi:hypothetical protein